MTVIKLQCWKVGTFWAIERVEWTDGATVDGWYFRTGHEALHFLNTGEGAPFREWHREWHRR